MGKYFGTDGFRGEVNVDLGAEEAYKIGRYIGWYYGQDPKEPGKCRVVIGKDPRRSSYMLEDALWSCYQRRRCLSAPCNHYSVGKLYGSCRRF